MYSKTIILSFLLAYAEARFGEEQKPVNAIRSLENRGSPGEAATLAGAVPGVVLAGANSCAKLELADRIVATLGDFDDVIAAARELVASEKNFNPFAVDIPSICSDVDLPATQALRGIVPLVDPVVAGSDIENANSAKSVVTPFDATGLSVADIMVANGFDNFTVQGSDGSVGPAPAAPAGNAGQEDADNHVDVEEEAEDAAAPVTVTVTVTTTPAGCFATAAPITTEEAAAPAANPLDFGSCSNPGIVFAVGLDGRSGESFAPSNRAQFSQGSALNQGIVTNFICGQLKSACGAPANTVSACDAAKAAAQALSGQAAADAFNTGLGLI